MDLLKRAIACDKDFIGAATKRAYELTGLENPNSIMQLKKWLEHRLAHRCIKIKSLSRKEVSNLAEKCDGEIEEILKLRLQ